MTLEDEDLDGAEPLKVLRGGLERLALTNRDGTDLIGPFGHLLQGSIPIPKDHFDMSLSESNLIYRIPFIQYRKTKNKKTQDRREREQPL